MRVQMIHPASDASQLIAEPTQMFIQACSPILKSKEDIRAMVQRLVNFEPARIILAIDGEAVVGWICVVPWDAGYATLHTLSGAKVGWPTVMPSTDEETVGKRLLEEAARVVTGKARTLLMCIEHQVEISDEEVEVLKERYQSLGFHYTNLVHYSTVLPSASSALSLPDDIQITPLQSAGEEALTACILDAFSGPAAQFFFGNSPEERDQYINGLLGSPASQESSSAVAYVGDELAGFVSSVGDDKNLLIDWLGIRPAWQRRGLGSLLLRHAMVQGQAAGFATVSGSANVANVASIGLLESLRWKRESGERQFVLVL